MDKREKATREDLIMMWMQLKHIAETVANQDAYKNKKWRLTCDWGEYKAGPDFVLWIGDSSLDIEAPHFYNTAIPEPEPEPEKEIELP